MAVVNRSFAVAATRWVIAATTILAGFYVAAFGNTWAPFVFELTAGSQLGAWLELVAPFLPMLLIGSGAALYTSQRWTRSSHSTTHHRGDE